MIHVFHGFLGSPSDFDFLKAPEVIIHDLYGRIPETKKDDILIGYSMGGRLAMELAKKNGFQKLILINAHPGLASTDELASRAIWEDEVVQKLQSENFLKWWNTLPIFEADRPIKNIPEGSIELFNKMRLSKQENFLPFLKENSLKVYWILGQRDPKYSKLRDSLLGFEVHMMDGGHRLFQKENELKKILGKIL